MKYVIIAAIFILIAFIGIVNRIPIGVEPLTEVYFENHTTLQSNILANGSYNFSFSVHNLEYRAMNYNYAVSATYLNKTVVLANGNFSLADNETRTFKQSYRIGEHFERAEISVLVTKDTNESIDLHFWVNEIVPLKITIERGNSTNSSSTNASS